jgi:hypothetical protein
MSASDGFARVAFGACWAENVCGSAETNESLVAWEAATRLVQFHRKLNKANGSQR